MNKTSNHAIKIKLDKNPKNITLRRYDLPWKFKFFNLSEQKQYIIKIGNYIN